MIFYLGEILSHFCKSTVVLHFLSFHSYCFHCSNAPGLTQKGLNEITSLTYFSWSLIWKYFEKQLLLTTQTYRNLLKFTWKSCSSLVLEMFLPKTLAKFGYWIHELCFQFFYFLQQQRFVIKSDFHLKLLKFTVSELIILNCES